MLDNTSKEAIAKITGMPYEDFKAKINAEEEQTIELPDGQYFTDTQLTARDGNKYTDFKKDFEQRTVKDLRTKFDYSFEGATFDNLFKHHDTQLKGKYQKDSSERVKELEADLDKVNSTYSITESNLKSQLEQLQTQNTVQSIKNDLLSVMPKETSVPSDDVLTLFLSKHKVKKDEAGNVYLEKDGQPLKDNKTAAYVNHKDVFQQFVEPYKKAASGRGGDNQNGSGQRGSNEDTHMESWAKQTGKPLSSQEAVQELLKYRKETK